MSALERLGGETWFQLGDRDLATHVLRTRELASGRSLSGVTGLLARKLGVAHTVAPMTDDPVRSVVQTDEGLLDFQDYFVRRQCRPTFRGVVIEGGAQSRPSADFSAALERADAIVLTPSNCFVSIDPILAVPGVSDALRRSGRPVVAVSPMVGGKAVKGPLGKMMAERGLEPSALGVARYYGGLVQGWVIDAVDRALAPPIEALGCRVMVRDTIMRTLDDKRRLAQDALQLASELLPAPVS
jgi:LPPG:FO 2-phospho-L-lactate transferase